MPVRVTDPVDTAMLEAVWFVVNQTHRHAIEELDHSSRRWTTHEGWRDLLTNMLKEDGWESNSPRSTA